jgi:predicted nucleic acid-binding Zn ribbon protein
MKSEFDETEFCAVCGKDANGDRWFCHFYREQERDTFCSPACAEIFLQRPTIIDVNETSLRGRTVSVLSQ